jgi:hypothetical protein
MHVFNKQIILTAALVLASAMALPASAFIYMGDDVPYMLGLEDTPPDDQSQQNNQQNNNQYRPTQYSSAMNTARVTAYGGSAGNGSAENACSKVHLEPAPNVPISQLKILGYWVGNLQYRVGEDAQNRLYVVSPQGRIAALPAGTQADNIAIPANNAFVQGMIASQPIPGEEAQLRRLGQGNGGGAARYITGRSSALRPVVMATRTTIVNGKPMIVGGAVISEIPGAQLAMQPRDTQQRSMARVITSDQKVTKRAKKHRRQVRMRRK